MLQLFWVFECSCIYPESKRVVKELDLNSSVFCLVSIPDLSPTHLKLKHRVCVYSSSHLCKSVCIRQPLSKYCCKAEFPVFLLSDLIRAPHVLYFTQPAATLLSVRRVNRHTSVCQFPSLLLTKRT